MEGVDGGDLLARQRECDGLERRRLQREPRVPPREKLFEVDRAISCWSKVGKIPSLSVLCDGLHGAS